MVSDGTRGIRAGAGGEGAEEDAELLSRLLRAGQRTTMEGRDGCLMTDAAVAPADSEGSSAAMGDGEDDPTPTEGEDGAEARSAAPGEGAGALGEGGAADAIVDIIFADKLVALDLSTWELFSFLGWRLQMRATSF